MRAILLIVHGYLEHIGRYEELFLRMAGEGFVVYGMDNLGNGGSGTPGMALEDMDRFYIQDIGRLLMRARRDYPGLPCFLFGHSLGSCMVRVFVGEHSREISGLILCATGYFPSFLQAFVPFLQKRQADARLVSVQIPSFLVSVDKENQRDYACDLLVPKRSCLGYSATAGLIILSSCRRGWAEGIREDLPILLVSGNRDAFGFYTLGVKRVYRELKKKGRDVSLKIYRPAKHEILHERGVKERVMEDILGFMEEHLISSLQRSRNQRET